jgi:hypothetical protein
MRVLLDECIPRKLKQSLSGHTRRTVPEQGLAGKKNGELLRAAERLGFEVFLTIDRGIEYEQNLQARQLAIIIVRTKSNRLADLLPCVPAIQTALTSVRPGQLVKVD